MRRETCSGQVPDPYCFDHHLHGIRFQIVGDAQFPQNRPWPDSLLCGYAFIAVQDDRQPCLGKGDCYGGGQLSALCLTVVGHGKVEQPVNSGANLRDCFFS